MLISPTPFTYQTDVVSQKQFDAHLRLYHNYVEKTNEITQKLAENTELASANAIYSPYRGLKKGETFALDGVILHEQYFQNLFTEHSTPGKKTRMLLEKSFGTVEDWQAAFEATAKAARGWAVLVYEQRTMSCRNILMDAHDEGVICGAYPLLSLDVYEHAYFLDYADDKAAYISRFLSQIPWSIVERRAAAVVRR